MSMAGRRKPAPKICPGCKSPETYKAVVGRVCTKCRLHYTTSGLEAMEYNLKYIPW